MKISARQDVWTPRMKTAIELFVAVIMCSLVASSIGEGTGQDLQPDRREDRNWSELIASMDKMHMSMSAVARSGNSDADFARLMLPHHQAALDMAKTELLYGKDPQMRRLAQEIITDQKLEMELMQRWLKQQHED